MSEGDRVCRLLRLRSTPIFAGRVVPPAPAGNSPTRKATLSALDREDMRALYRWMVLTRSLEERLEVLFKQGHVVGGLYRSLGQEATAVGSARALAEGDWLAPSIRDVGALFVRGLSPEEMLRQYTARGTSLCRGKDNTTHFTVPELGLLGPISPLGTQLCVLNGIALSFRKRGERRVCLTYQGDGASRTGASHEGLAMAAALELPIVVILEHNRWAFGTRSNRQAAVERWADIGEAYGIPAGEVDGNDVLQVHEVTARAVDRARDGGGPTLIVAQTYRMLGHAQHDAQAYVPAGDLEAWRARDPIRRFEAHLQEFGFETEGSLAAIREEVAERIDEAVEAVLREPVPAAGSAREGVYGDPALDPAVPWTRGGTVYADLTATSPEGPGRQA